ncbi:MAG: hypothetical protein PHD54_09600 [Desulfuromonadaceae bacterium]|nr:hypothetical protein [Desulfuromonadaceae bacterium]
MKTILRALTVVAAALVLAIPVLAEENAVMQQEPQAQKNECLLVAKNCPTDSIQERIQRIQGEIMRGSDVYTNDELRRLNNELQEYQKMLNNDLTGGGA